MMNSFEKYEVIFWDFDGVILDSMLVRDQGFIEVLQNFPDHKVNELLEYHRDNGGLSRYVKFRYFYEYILNRQVSDSQVNELALEFSTIMRGTLADPDLLIQDSLKFIKTHHAQYAMHIVSGSDGNELKYLCDELNISKYFLSISGSPTPKNKLVFNILEKQIYDRSNCVLIGDSWNDFDAAEKNGIDFMGYNNLSINHLGVLYIDSFPNKPLS